MISMICIKIQIREAFWGHLPYDRSLKLKFHSWLICLKVLKMTVRCINFILQTDAQRNSFWYDQDVPETYGGSKISRLKVIHSHLVNKHASLLKYRIWNRCNGIPCGWMTDFAGSAKNSDYHGLNGIILGTFESLVVKMFMWIQNCTQIAHYLILISQGH